MIKLLRVDDRLLHGQVAFAWTKSLKVNLIIVANDKIAHDEFTKMTLGLAKPQNVNLTIVEVKKAVEILKTDKAKKYSSLIIVNNLEDAKELIMNVDELHSLNLGGLREREGSTRYTNAITLTEKDVDICREILDKGYEIEARQMPSDNKQDIKDLIK
ncbi:PTS system mannose-specific IIB component/fructoselysine and glucoselysine-specific PTS system IIB component [Breznakia blatticola]|uniref:PTS system mannose-specific IIB component/fructoselysine and glucoselysine-specific PTS system IIB component n=1 Tax=Breznakia blatticola TaxID=1754012 RepID=A0A4R7ZJ15_9FIRM|nr:PTS sugar transporter subunit IIB [Breznakia blatticola]TDW16378.1 PTS system mannose-specific IIB component/fructoselysine and glucoselysine-specific PTS system IIB component [Breznakia blatticola]